MGDETTRSTPEPKKKEENKKETIRYRILEAARWTQDGRPDRGFKEFENLIPKHAALDPRKKGEPGSDTDQKAQAEQAKLSTQWEELTDRQRNWCLVHQAEAISKSFIPYADREDSLKRAEVILRSVLNIKDSDREGGDDPLDAPDFAKSDRVRNPWAWAKLGEIFRQMGNLPPIGFELPEKEERHRLRLFLNRKRYIRSEKCFEIALAQRNNDYPWAQAHYGAMLVNARRYSDFALKQDKARKLLRRALESRNYDYPWAALHLGAAHYANAIRQLSVTPVFVPWVQNLLLVPFYMLNSSEQTSELMRFAVQPGAIALDPYLALTQDLLDWVDEFQRNQPNSNDGTAAATNAKGDDDDVPSYNPLLMHTIRQMQKICSNHGARRGYADSVLPESSNVRNLYLKLYVAYLTTSINGGNNLGPRDDDTEDTIAELEFNFREIAKNPILQAGVPTFVCDGFRIRLFDLMMTALKTQVIKDILKSSRKFDVSDFMHRCESALALLRPQLGGDEKARCDEAKSKLREFVVDDKNHWLLAPIWLLETPVEKQDNKRRSRTAVLKELLNLDGPDRSRPATTTDPNAAVTTNPPQGS